MPDPPVAVPGPASEPADPVVSPADTIRRARNRIAARGQHDLVGLADLADALLAVGERDRRQIARLTKRDDWLLKQIDGCIDSAETLTSAVGLSLARALVGDLRDARAVLADEEDALSHSFGEQGIRPEPNHTWPEEDADNG